MTVKTLRRQLAAAIAMTLVATVALGSSTYAWFTMNKTVTVTGMEMKTVVGDSLLIAPSEADTAISADSAFTNGIHQLVYGVLQPVSTINAADTGFYYTYDAKADGSKATSTATNPYNLVSNNTVTVDTTNYKAYVDYVFEIKAINSDASAKELRLTKLNLLYDGVAINEHSYRVAVFQQDVDGSAYVARPANASKIFAPTGFTYFDGTAVDSTATKAAVSTTVNGTAWTKSIPGNSTDYTQLTFRFWIEGEDTDCYSAKYLDLTKEWTLDLQFDLASSSTDTETAAAVTQIASSANASADATSKAATLSVAGETAVSYQWFIDNPGDLLDTEVSGQTAATYSGAAGDVYCVITTAKGTKYRTNTITVE